MIYLKLIVLGIETPGLQPGEFVSSAGAAEANRELVVEESAATTAEHRRTAGEACAVLLATAGESHLTRQLFASMVRRIAGLLLPTDSRGRGRENGNSGSGGRGCAPRLNCVFFFYSLVVPSSRRKLLHPAIGELPLSPSRASLPSPVTPWSRRSGPAS